MTDAVLTLGGIGKSFGPLRVLDEVSFTVGPGECVGLCGENGAGKSTLLRIIMGLETHDAGVVTFAAGGLGMVHQHFSLVPSASVAENVWLGAEPRRHFALLDRAKMAADTLALANSVGFTLDPSTPVERLTVGEKQRVEVLKALRTGQRLLLLDEPTAVLAKQEIDAFLGLLDTLKARGTAMVFVSHKLGEVARVCDRAIVLRRGRVVASMTPREDNLHELAAAMLGDAPSAGGFVSTPATLGAADSGLVATNLAAKVGASALVHASFSVPRGQIFGVAGVDGNGQDALFCALAGVAEHCRGDVTLGGDAAFGRAPARIRRAAGLRSVPADRHALALLPTHDVRDNLLLGQAPAADSTLFQRLRAFDVRPPELDRNVLALSGGNQQKMLFARELATTPQLLLLHEPSRGVDLHARERIWSAIRACAKDGASVVVISSDYDELKALCDRLAVLYRGTLSPGQAAAETTDAQVGRLMAGLV